MSVATALAKQLAGSRRRPPVRVNCVSIDRLSLDQGSNATVEINQSTFRSSEQCDRGDNLSQHI